MRSILFALVLLAGFSRTSDAEVTIRIVTSASQGKHEIIVEELSSVELKFLIAQPVDSLHRFFNLYVHQEPESAVVGLPSVLGDRQLIDERLVFTPRFELQPGQRYRAEYTPPKETGTAVSKSLMLTALAHQPVTELVGIFPSSSELPQNLLKFYLYFSAPMQQGNAYRFIQITTSEGKPLAFPFLELAEELWDASGKRLTLLLDPARVKRGLVPREEDGAIFEVGNKYRLTIRKEWLDAIGQPMVADAIKEFSIVTEDFEQPDASNWIVLLLDAAKHDTVKDRSEKISESTQHRSDRPLDLEIQVVFPEPLDRGLLEHSISVFDSAGKTIAGKVQILDNERRWCFSPESKMPAGEYVLKVNPLLEDLTGNSLERAFEVDLSKPILKPAPTTSRRFNVP
ncbi:MAG: hypothetical protein SGI77_03815 [Pirellulaceae bacterium]|nr:hypothetical protein [Pirellulaceae bacterium]